MLTTQSSSKAAVAADSSTSTPSTHPTHVPLILEITHGRTRFRERPVHGPRFLIGAGAACDLRLGGDGMPPLHSIITIDGDEICLEAIARSPSLLINGRRQINALLVTGDVIQLGSVEMVARIPHRRPELISPLTLAPGDPELGAESEQDLAELSASELIDLIEQEESEIARFESLQRQGAAALLELARKSGRPAAAHRVLHSESAADGHAPHFKLGIAHKPIRPRSAGTDADGADAATVRTDDKFLNDLEEMGRSLSLFSKELARRAQHSSERETGYASAVTLLLETQQKLVSQVEQLLVQVSELRSSHGNPEIRPRAIA